MKRQVLVIGAGPAGSSAAFYCAQAGLDTLLIDKETWPREKICGDAYLKSLTKHFEKMGIKEEMRAAAMATPYIMINYGPDQVPVTFVEEPGEDLDLIIHRRIGDDIIRRGALRGGADWLENCEAKELIMEKGQVKGARCIYHDKEMIIEADVTIIADGSHSVLAQQLGAFFEDDFHTMIATKGWFTGCENLNPHETVQFYDADCLPGDPGLDSMVAGWVIPMDNDPTTASVGIGVPLGVLRAHNMSADEYFNWWLYESEVGKKYLAHAKCVDGMKGWRLPTNSRILKNYYAGCILIGDSIGAAEPAYYYGIPSGMKGGQVAGEVLPGVFEKGDFSEEALKVFYDRYYEVWGTKIMYYELFRKSLISNREVFRGLLQFAKEQPEYPDNLPYSKTVNRYFQKLDIQFPKRGLIKEAPPAKTAHEYEEMYPSWKPVQIATDEEVAEIKKTLARKVKEDPRFGV